MQKLDLGMLRSARRQKHLSTRSAAAVIGKDKNAIFRYENGITSPRVKDLLALLDAYGIEAKDVFSHTI